MKIVTSYSDYNLSPKGNAHTVIPGHMQEHIRRQVQMRLLEVPRDPTRELVPLVVTLVPPVGKHHHACAGHNHT